MFEIVDRHGRSLGLPAYTDHAEALRVAADFARVYAGCAVVEVDQ